MRNGLAIAGMAGGLWFLGNAVANADQTTGIDQTNHQVTSTEGGSSGGNEGANIAIAKNQQNTSVQNNASIANGGSNSATVNASVYGNTVNGGSGDTKVTVTTNVTVNQAANGGTSNGSGNMAVNGVVPQSSAGNQSITINQDNKQKSESEGPSGIQTASLLPFPTDGSGGNSGFNFAFAKNEKNTSVENNASVANGGTNDADVDASVYGNRVNCGGGLLLELTLSERGGDCTVKVTTNATVNQQANGGTAINSGNMGVNAPVPGSTPPATPPQKRPEHKAVVAVAAAKKAVALSSAQPKAALATTGAEYGLPLTLGLIALGAGAGLTVAGRRRTSTTA